jgi:hypothetical protein
VAADNLFQDAPLEARRRQAETIRGELGACRPEGPFQAENALRGAWLMTCDKGTLRVTVTLAPTVPPKIQFWDMTPGGRLPPLPGTATCPQ